MSDHGLIARALQFHPWDAMARAALESLVKRGPFQFSAEDDIQIPSVHELARFMRMESYLVLKEVAVRTAFFRKTRECDLGPDGCQHQGMNRRKILQYSWRDRLRRVSFGAEPRASSTPGDDRKSCTGEHRLEEDRTGGASKRCRRLRPVR